MNQTAPSRKPRKLVFAALAFLPLWGSAGPASPPGTVRGPEGRVVVLGFDGGDARTVRELVEAHPGRFPTFERLAREGTFAPLEVVTPPESPVSWASLNTGQNPAKTGVPGFIRREIREGVSSPLPNFGHLVQGDKALSELEGAPLPGMAAGALGALVGAAGFLVGFLLSYAVSRRGVVALLGGLVVGGAAGWMGWTLRSMLPETYPHTGNVVRVAAFWDHAAEAGVPVVVLDAAQAWDRESPEGARVLAGLGVPDARNQIGNWFVYTTDPEEFDREGRSTSTSGTVYRVDEYDGVIEANLYGPKNFWLQERLKARKAAIDAKLDDPELPWEKVPSLSEKADELERQLKELDSGIPVPMRIELQEQAATIEVAGQRQTLAVGEWSDFFEVSFDLNWLVSVRAITRAKLVQLDPYFELYVDVLNIDPREPPFWQPISSPADFSSELVAACGHLYETYGWPTPTMPLKDKEIAPETLLEDVEFTMKWREDLTLAALRRDDWRCLMSVFSTPDRVQHMMYRYYDPLHPLYDAEEAGRPVRFFGKDVTLADAIPVIYEQIDRVIGEVLDELRPEDTLLVCADHGFQSFRRQVHINNWLAENGYLKIRPGVSKSSASALAFVDWSQTRVYSLGLGFLYVNLKGREPQGIVEPSEKRALMEEVREKLLQATDPDTGERFCKDVYIVEDRHDGEWIGLEADMITGFAPPYRVGWSTSSGGLYMVREEEGGLYQVGPVCSDNTSPWSGGHVSMSLPDVAGIFFSNRPVQIPEEGVRALHIAPTVLSLLGVPVPGELDLEPLRVQAP